MLETSEIAHFIITNNMCSVRYKLPHFSLKTESYGLLQNIYDLLQLSSITVLQMTKMKGFSLSELLGTIVQIITNNRLNTLISCVGHVNDISAYFKQDRYKIS